MKGNVIAKPFRVLALMAFGCDAGMRRNPGNLATPGRQTAPHWRAEIAG